MTYWAMTKEHFPLLSPQEDPCLAENTLNPATVMTVNATGRSATHSPTSNSAPPSTSNPTAFHLTQPDPSPPNLVPSNSAQPDPTSPDSTPPDPTAPDSVPVTHSADLKPTSNLKMPINPAPALPKNHKILYLSYNEDASCFVVGTDRGFLVYNSDPFQERFRRELSGGVSLVEIYGRSNLVLLVGKVGPRSIGPPNNLIIWDDRQGKAITELTFGTEIRAIKCRGKRLIVVERSQISLYQITNLSLEAKWQTSMNIHGLVAMNHPEAEFPLIAFPDRQGQKHGQNFGYLRLEYFKGSKAGQGLTIEAHTTPLSQIALTQNGRLVATSSERGTLIRIWCTSQGTKLRELRRGLQTATIQSLVLHPTGRALVVSSSQGTVHIYSLASRMSVEDDYNRRSSLSFLSGVLPKYFSSEWSMISFQGFANQELSNSEPQQIRCAFGSREPGTLVLIGDAGYYEKYRYTTQEYRVIDQKRFTLFSRARAKDP